MLRAAALAACLVVAALGQEFPEDLSQLKGAVTAVVFISARCQISNAYGSRLEALYREYTPRGVRLLFVNSNSNETEAEIAENARAHRFTFRIYRDSASKAANLLGAQLTPEAFVLDRDAVVRYHGAIDDSRNPARVKTRSLRQALDSVLAGRPLATSESKAFGCTIKRPQPEGLQPIGELDYPKLIESSRSKILLVDFWATWCGPCREDLPRLAALAKRLPFQLATISADEPEQAPEAVRLLLAEHIPGPFYRQAAADNDRFINAIDPAWSGALPALFLYDRFGRRAGSFIGEPDMAEVETSIRGLLDRPR